MEWKRLQQKDDYFEGIRFNGEVYNEHMVLLISFNDFYEYEGTHQLRCWNIRIQYLILYFSFCRLKFMENFQNKGARSLQYP